MFTKTLRQHLVAFTVVLALLAVNSLSASAFSNAPGSCTAAAFYPTHGSAQSGNGGFSLAASSPTYNPGQVLTITLSGTQNFLGLLLYAFDSAGTHRGTFQIPAGYQPMNGCGGDPGATLGQSNATSKPVPVNLNWTAPTSNDPLTFVAVVLTGLTVYYVLDPIVVQPAASAVGPGNSVVEGAGGSFQITPNPFATTASIQYSLQTGSSVSLRVYDIVGQLVRSFAQGSQEPGVHTVAWNGRDDSGADLGTGVFFIRLDAGGTTQVRKALRVEPTSAAH